ncbi:MAG: transporter [Pedosphaera sp.]|nr:transporter [Pedosphaera sp.]
MKTVCSFKLLTLTAVAGVSLAGAINTQADHGPGTSGGGVLTQSGETLKPGRFSVELREDLTEFQDLSLAQIEAKAARAGGIDLLDRSFLSSVGVSYGVVENFQVGLTLGYYNAVNAREAEFDSASGETEMSTLNPDGLTDLWLSGKYRFYRGPLGQFAVFGGVKFPTGRYDVKNSAGERVEPSATAGSGSYDGMLGLAYSRFLTSRITLDTSVQYTHRTEADHFRLGDRIDAGLAFAYRFTEDIQAFPQIHAFAEANVRSLFKSQEDGASDPNTGGTALFLTPGVRIFFARNLAFTVSAPLPVVQDLNGEQLKTSFKVNGALTVLF